jgi:catecholate siderophore receptor
MRSSFASVTATSLLALAAPAFAAEAGPGELAASAAAAAADSGESQETVIVKGERERYGVRRVTSATKTETPLQDVPQAVSVITAEQIDDQGLRSISDVLRYVPGAAVTSGEGHRDAIILRGNNSTADFFVDGIRDDVQYYRGLYNLDRIEVLKGPNAMIFGRGGGGGVVNRVTKRPDERGQFVQTALAPNSLGAWYGQADLNSPFGEAFAGRLNGVYEEFDSFRDHVDGHRLGLNPTLAWQLGESTRIDLSYEYARDRRTVDRGIPSLKGRPLNGAQEDFFGDPDINKTRLDAHVGDLAIEHRFSDAIRWNGKLRLATYDKFYRNALAATAVTGSDTVGIEAYQSATKRDALFVQNDLVAKLTTGPVRHTTLAGVDHSRQDTFSDRQQGFFDSSPTAVNNKRRLFVSLGSTDSLPAITFRDDPSQRATAADTDAIATGLYVQEQAEIGEHVEIIAGLRRDWFKLDYHDLIGGARLSRKDALWSPRLGLVVKPVETLSFYGSWSKSFLPQSGDQFSSLTATTASLEPEKFVNREMGLKWSMTPHFDVTLAAYVLDRTNTRATDPVTHQTVLTGEQRSKGIEASAQGRLTSKLSIAASAALQDAEITKTTAAAPAGRKVASVPKFTASLWGRYDFTNRLGAGLGAYHQSKTYASISNAVVVPGFTRFDAAAFIGLMDNVELQLNVENVFDKKYIGLAHTDNNLTPANPRTLRATVRFGL